MHGLHPEYQPPHVSDYGDLRGITASYHPLVSSGGADLSFSPPGPHSTPGDGEIAVLGRRSSSGGDPSGSGGSSPTGSSGGGGGGLPFTGLAIGAVAAAGSGLTAAGALLRRVARRRARR
jgi:hypothetical protein